MAEIIRQPPKGQAAITALDSESPMAQLEFDGGLLSAKFKLSGRALEPSAPYDSSTDHLEIKFTLVAATGQKPPPPIQEKWYIRNNSNVTLEEVLAGEAVFVYDGDEERYGNDNRRGVSSKEVKRFDEVQELLNQVVPRKRSVGVTDYAYIDMNGVFSRETVAALSIFKENFRIDNASLSVNAQNSFNKLRKDYTHTYANPWPLLIEDMIVSKELLVGLRYNLTDNAPNTIVGGDVGLYELYENSVKRFVDAMIAEADRFREEPTRNWVARTGQGPVGDKAHGPGMSYCFGCKQSVAQFNSTVSHCPPPTPNDDTFIELDEREWNQVSGDEYRGNLNESCQVDGSVSAGASRWPGLNSSEYFWQNQIEPFKSRYWAGVDCSGLVTQAVEKAKSKVPSVNVRGTAKLELSDRYNVNTTVMFETEVAQYMYYQPRIQTSNLGKIEQQEKLRKGDLVSYPGHVSIVYSGKPENDGSYDIIHAYGAATSYVDGDVEDDPLFTRKVVVTSNNVRKDNWSKELALEKKINGYGRVKLWD